MKIFAITSVVPFRSHGEPGVTATHLITGALLMELQKRGHDIVLQCLLYRSERHVPLTSAEALQLRFWEEQGMKVLPSLYRDDHLVRDCKRLRALRLMRSTEAALWHFYPIASLRPILLQRLSEHMPDVILPLWAAYGVAATWKFPFPRVAYHGDIDFAPHRARFITDPSIFLRTTSSPWHPGRILYSLDQRLRLLLYERAHLALMRDLSAIANVTACNNSYYERHGHPRSRYVGNVWPDQGAFALVKTPAQQVSRLPIRIIGHLGYLDRTGGTYGLRFLLRDVLPYLERAMEGRPYEVHIIGGGDPAPGIYPFLSHPRIMRRGFVPDLDRALAECDVFCLFNNAGPYIAAYTRHIVAWSAGLCLVAHTRSKEAIPEIVHGQNTLLARSGADAAKFIAQAALDRVLNLQIRMGGRATYERFFTPERVAKNLEDVLREGILVPRA